MLMITPRSVMLLEMEAERRRRLHAGLAASEKRRDVPVTLPKLSIQRPRKLSRAKHDSILDSIVRVLKSYTFSKFEYEGPCISGLRTALCLDGWSFPDADRVAREIVETGLRRIGAVRPTWGEGQPDFTGYSETGRTRCIRCATEIPEERFRFHAEVKYCDDVCQRADRDDRRGADYQARSLAEWLAECAVRSRQKLMERARNCETCGTHFLTRRADARYCGQACAKEGQKTIPARDCQQCGTSFRPANGGKQPGKYCSRTCQGLAGRKARPKRSCPACSSLFTVRYENDPQTYCSLPCSKLGRQLGRLGIVCEAVT